jgi:peroxiredoxin
MVRKTTLALAVVSVALFSAVRCFGEDLKIGADAPDFSGIIGVDDKQHDLAEYKKAKAIVLVFTCNHCPVAQAYEDRLVEFQKQYKEKGVQVIAVNVNNLPEDRLDAMKQRAKEKKFNFPYLYDESQKIGRDYDAKVTPHVFILDAKRKLAYRGAFDDNMNAEKVENHYASVAVEAVLADKKPDPEITRQFGCGIKYEEKE